MCECRHAINLLCHYLLEVFKWTQSMDVEFTGHTKIQHAGRGFHGHKQEIITTK